MMKLLLRSRLSLIIVAAILMSAFSLFTLVAASNLNYATLQGIDGPLSAREISALQLSNSLTSVAVGIMVGVAFLGITAVIFRKRSVEEVPN
jgi:hypothetical protein